MRIGVDSFGASDFFEILDPSTLFMTPQLIVLVIGWGKKIKSCATEKSK